MATADPIGWADPDRIDYYNYLRRRQLAGSGAARLEIKQVAAMLQELRKKEDLSVKVLSKRRKLCELLFLSAEQAITGL